MHVLTLTKGKPSFKTMHWRNPITSVRTNSRAMKRLLLATLSCFCCHIVFSQPDSTHVYRWQRATINVTWIDIDWGPLNQILAEEGYATFNQIYQFEYTLSAKKPDSRWGSSFSVIQIESKDNDERTIQPGTTPPLEQNRTLRGWGIQSSSDFYWMQGKWYALYTPLCFQLTKHRLSTYKNIPIGLGLSRRDGVDSGKFTSWRWSAEAGLNAEVAFRTGRIIWILGANAGYRLDLSNSEWRYDDEINAQFPEFENSGFIWGVIFGASVNLRE